MSAIDELSQIVASMREIEGRFQKSRQMGDFLVSEDEAEFRRLAVEAKAIADAELGRLNDFSMQLLHPISSPSGAFGGLSRAAALSAVSTIDGAINQIRRVNSQPQPAQGGSAPPTFPYVDPSRIVELSRHRGKRFDMTRAIRLAEELNIASQNGCHMSVAMLVRAIVDHLPPVLGCGNFQEVANNYGGSRSFQRSMKHLQGSLRNIADAHLHLQVRSSEVLPNASQVDFKADLDTFLSEVVRVLKEP